VSSSQINALRAVAALSRARIRSNATASGIGFDLGTGMTRRFLKIWLSRPLLTSGISAGHCRSHPGARGEPADTRENRSREVTREFQREHPCPSTGQRSGACPGYRKDHVVPLACGGPDAVSNLQWQTIAGARKKDRWERKACGR